ncbi:MAG: DUF177 domain-containing protein [Marinilabiliaceae bacterium]|jgi:uncharacterized metal-binding protein YceD (DUF177 family)|nr:DUF177 domain-containing protein [Marinilabiliaceae bacterium]
MSGIYSIPISGLKEGSHEFDFDIDRDFFDEFEESEILDSRLKVIAVLVKRSAHMELELSLRGDVLILCDRCLENYWQKIEVINTMLVKFGEEWDEADDEVLSIPHGESYIELGQLIYEFAHLALPLQRVHPDNKSGESTCNSEMLEQLDKHTAEKEENIDPRWKDLVKLKEGLKN